MQAGARLVGYLKSLGVKAVLDLSSARDIALMETAAEFCHRFRSSGSATGQMEVDGTEAASAPSAPLPMLASACPGYGTCATQPRCLGAQWHEELAELNGCILLCCRWVCYAEKTHGEYVLPHISTAKSPQAVMGTLLKRQVAACHGLDPAKVFHCSLQVCVSPTSSACAVNSYLKSALVFAHLNVEGCDHAAVL